MDSNTTTPKSNKKNQKPTSDRKQIKLPFNKDNLFVPADQLTKIPKREDDQYLAGDLVWGKTKGFPWWACMITVDPETGKYSKSIVIRDKNEKVFHVQYFGSKPYRGYTQGNIMKYEGKQSYELKLDQIKNTPTPNKSQRKQELLNYEIKQSFKKEWSIACDEADEAMKLDRVKRIETLTFEYILDKPKSLIKQEEKKSIEKATPAKSTEKASVVKSTTSKKRKIDDKTTPSTSKKTPTTKRKKKSEKSSPGDVYDFNDFSDEFDETPKKPFELSSAKRAKGEYEIYAKKERANIEKENPELDANEVEKKLRNNWSLMSEDMRNGYGPIPSYHSNSSFHLESPSRDNTNSNILDTSSKQIKTYSGSKRGRKPSINKKENDFEKENTVDKEKAESEDEESTTTANRDEKETNQRRSSRKKLFKQGNEEVNDEKSTVSQTEQTPTTAKRVSARMRSNGKINTSNKTPLSKRESAKKQNSIKKLVNNHEESINNNLSEDSQSYSSEGEKTEQKEIEEKDKERYCGKCKDTAHNLVKCEGDCLTWYHKECLHKEESSEV